MLTFGSLFAGIGGIDLGLERAGMTCAWQVEIDEYATRVLAKHWPNVQRFRDVTECGAHNLARVDLIAAGFPCQDISYAGRGAGIEGERSGLFFEAIRVVRELRPRYVLLENVAALVARGLDRVLGTLAEIGYDAEWHCLQAADFGAPHIRDRVFILAYTNTNGSRERCGDTNNERGRPTRARETSVSPGRVIAGTNTQSAGQVSDTTRADTDTSGVRLPDGENEVAQIESIDGRSIRAGNVRQSEWWSIEPDVGRVAHGVPKRVDRLRGLGNAVVPQVAEWIGREIINAC